MKKYGMRFKKQSHFTNGLVMQGLMSGFGDSIVNMEFVNSVAFAQQDARVDFDVNNLKVGDIVYL